MSHSTKKLLFITTMFLLSLLACSIGLPKKAAEALPQPPGGHIETSEEAVTRAKGNFSQAVEEAKGGHETTFRITSEETTSVVAQLLQTRADIPISAPQIWFTAGKIYMLTKFEGLGPASVSALIVMRPLVTDDGQLQVELVDAKMGAFSVPDAVIDNLTETINETLANAQFNIKITGIDIREGEMIIAGKRTD